MSSDACVRRNTQVKLSIKTFCLIVDYSLDASLLRINTEEKMLQNHEVEPSVCVDNGTERKGEDDYN